MTYHFIDKPKPQTREAYECALDKIVKVLAPLPFVESVYQIGSVSTPGISDLDVVVVFSDDIDWHEDPRTCLDEKGRYLFVHRLFGETQTNFERTRRVSLFHNFVHLHGVEQETQGYAMPADELAALKAHIAVEYLLRFYINLVVSRAYGVIKLRGLFLHVKGLLYDLEFLNTSEGEFFDSVAQFISYRDNWFERPASEQEMSRALDRMFHSLEDYLNSVVSRFQFFLPARAGYEISSNLQLIKSDSVSYRHRGVILPGFLGAMHPKVVSLQNRINSFAINLPFQVSRSAEVVRDRFSLTCELRRFHEKHLPGFESLASGLCFLVPRK